MAPPALTDSEDDKRMLMKRMMYSKCFMMIYMYVYVEGLCLKLYSTRSV